MLCNRIKQFREYNKVDIDVLSKLLGISADEYIKYETGEDVPTINIIESLAKCYKVTIDEFYGYTPRLSLSTNDMDLSDDVDEVTLKMADLSWEEKQLILNYRNSENKDDIIDKLLKNPIK